MRFNIEERETMQNQPIKSFLQEEMTREDRGYMGPILRKNFKLLYVVQNVLDFPFFVQMI
jgi:hypothetical protein